MKGAGILFICNGNALFLKRGPTAPDCPSCWDFPGGGQEAGEEAIDTALREAQEEVGRIPVGERTLHTRTRPSARPKAQGIMLLPAGAPIADPAMPIAPMPEVDFSTFIQKVDEEFVPMLNDEHVGWAWAPLTAPPEPLHPGCRIALDRIAMDELGVARAIADGRLTSPQHYENMTLFAIRITGTGVAYRNKLNEFVHRGPENYLNDEFLARCNGLPVIYVQRSGKSGGFHPKGAILNSDEFTERVVGSIFLPYIAGDEVWGIAKIHDDAAALDMEDKQLSTSPAVFFQDVSVNSKMKLEDGSSLLIEGKPSLLDHVAVCELGVWDKGGEPSGVRSESREDSTMTEEEQKAAEAKKADEEAEAKKKADAAGDDKLSKIADSLDSMHKRMDAFEAKDKERADAEAKMKADAEEEARKKGEPEQLAADKAKKDAEEKEAAEKEEKAKKDAAEKAKADAEDIKKRIADVEAKIPKSYGDADYVALTGAQSRADDVYSKFGKSAPRPLDGETPAAYERRCVRELKVHSPTWKAAEVGAAFADDASFAIVRDQVYREATVTALNPDAVEPGRLREIVQKSGGHEIRTFVGNPRSWMDPMAGAPQLRAEGSFKTGGLGN